MGLLDRLFGPPTKDKFARLMADAIRAAGEPTPLRYEAERNRLVVDGAAFGFFNLDNAYREYCSTPAGQRPDVVRRFVRVWLTKHREMPGEFEDVRPDLLPVIRNRATFALQKLELEVEGQKAFDWPFQVVAEHLGLGLAYDLPASIVMLTQDQLGTWDVSFEDALETACANLTEISGQALDSLAPGVWLSPWHDNYDATRLILLDLIRAYEVKGDTIAMVPNRDHLLLTGADDPVGLAALAALADKALESPRPLTALAFRLEDDVWQPYLPDEDHPLYGQFKLLQIKSLGQDYAGQKELLDRWFLQKAENVLVAGYALDSGATRSYCAWSEGVHALLPRTDDIRFFQPDPAARDGKLVGQASWDKAAALLGDRLQPTDMYPERYFVKSFPTAAELTVLRDA